MDTILSFVCTNITLDPGWHPLLIGCPVRSCLSAFLIELLSSLQQDPMETIQDILIYQTYMMRNSNLGPYVPPSFSPPYYIEVVNALFYASLGLTLLVAFISMLIKSWVRESARL